MDQQIPLEKRICEVLAEIIRRRSETGLLIEQEEIFGELKEDDLKISGDRPAEEESLLKKAIEENEDLKGLSGPDGKIWFYSARWMSEAYARILSQKKGDPLTLMAETIRENSSKYPRPIPLDVFQNPPFEMTEEEVQSSLQKMKEQEGYEDIATTATSIGTVFLYSKAHLEADHAAMLAEWMDVGQANNP